MSFLHSRVLEINTSSGNFFGTIFHISATEAFVHGSFEVGFIFGFGFDI